MSFLTNILLRQIIFYKKVIRVIITVVLNRNAPFDFIFIDKYFMISKRGRK